MWDPARPTKELPVYIRRYFYNCVDELFDELKYKRMIVGLIDAPKPRFDGYKIRVLYSPNPEWYSRLYSACEHFRRDRSLSALEKIKNEKDRPFKVRPYRYDWIYRTFIFERLTGVDNNGSEKRRPAKKVCRFFEKNKLENIV